MSRRLQTFVVITGVIVVLGGLWVVDNFIYPLKAEQPNFSDVEKAFAKLTFPSDWVEVSSSENRGMFGRGCDPFNDSGCFHKSKTFKVPENTSRKSIENIMQAPGLCPAVIIQENNPVGGERYTSLRCGIDELHVSLATTVTYKSLGTEVSIGVDTPE